MENNKIKIEKEFDINTYWNDGCFKLFTKIGLPVYIIDDTVYLDKNNHDNLSIVGMVEYPNGNRTVKVWDRFGKNTDDSMSIIMVKYVTPNYDHITSKDLPNTEEFEKEYEHNQKYYFKMSKVEYLRYKKFKEDHKNCKGSSIVSFCSTGIGDIVQAKCTSCGMEVDLTDDSDW